MPFQPDPARIVWRIHFASPPEEVFAALSTDEGRERFWVESSREDDGVIEMRFNGGHVERATVVVAEAPRRWVLRYMATDASFGVAADGDGGCDLTLTLSGFADEDRCEWAAGWLNVLLPMKAAVDHGVDLRNHDPTRTWEGGYADQ